MPWPKFIKSKRFNDNVYGSIDVPYPINLIIDTVEFQRLRNLKQLGFVNLVYPNCEHSRFVHSLGTFYLANKMVSKLRNRDENISCEDHLCVCIAALLHDIGHGPFSHLFDNDFMKACGETWKHEEMSIRLIDRILMRNEKVKSALGKYLGEGSDYINNVTFIKELVNPPIETLCTDMLNENDDYNTKETKLSTEWNAKVKGRGIEKSFLYDIVSNSMNGHDVDKMDYLLRDSAASGVPITLSRDLILERLFENCLVARDPFTGMRHIAYKEKCKNDVKHIGDCRQELHSKVYQHKTVRGIQTLFIKAMCLANDHLTYQGSDKNYKLSEVIHDEEAFLKTSDFVEYEIMNSTSTDPQMLEAKEYLRMIRDRAVPCTLTCYELSPTKADALNDNNNFTANPMEILNKIKDEVNRLLNNEHSENYIIMHSVLGKGLDAKTHPIARQLLVTKETDGIYDLNTTSTPTGFYLNQEFIDNNFSQIAAKWEFFVLGNRKLLTEQRKIICSALTQALINLNLALPNPRKRENSQSVIPRINSNANAKRKLVV